MERAEDLIAMALWQAQAQQLESRHFLETLLPDRRGKPLRLLSRLYGVPE
jgi:hypothetical protein